MSSDIDYDYFDYNSSQDYFDIEDQIDLFEFRQYQKKGKRGKLKLKQTPYPISAKKLRSQPTSLKLNCQPDKQTPKAKPKRFRYPYTPSISSKTFEYDRQIRKQNTSSSDKESKPSNKLTAEHLTNFSDFRDHFYRINREHIKSSLPNDSYLRIVNIRPASIDKSVEEQFMKRLNRNYKHLPHLVYHGTELKNISSILRFGFLVPNQEHPRNKEAPIIRSINGQAFGTGIYCSPRATYSITFTRTANTLLVCAAISNTKNGKMKYYFENILVLPHVSQIVPLFLLDFTYSGRSGFDRQFFNQNSNSTMAKDESEKDSTVISKKISTKSVKFSQ